MLRTRSFPTPLEKKLYPYMRKKVNILEKNYRLVSLLEIYGKIFEYLIYNKVYPYLFDNNLISSHQSGFKQGILALTCFFQPRMKYKSFDEGFEVREVFLDISKYSMECDMTVLYSNFRKRHFW